MTNERIQAHSRRQIDHSEVTNVIRIEALALLILMLCGSLAAQAPESATGPAESLYLSLHSVGLDKTHVYKIRDGALDRGSMHLSFDDGSIAFTQEAGGHITGAFFRGEGELLLTTPDTVERASVALFTGAAILEEKFSIAYLRFNDDVLEELRPSLRDAGDADKFSSDWDGAAKILAQEDALRLLVSFSNGIGGSPGAARPNDHLLHAYLQGGKHGNFDVRYDSLLQEQISAGQHKNVNGVNYYDVWTSFSVPAPAGTKAGSSHPPAPEFEITRFNIQSQIRPPTELESTATLDIVPRRSDSRLLLFELSRLLQVKSAQIDGQPVEYIHNQAVEGSQLAHRGNDVLAVLLPSAVRPGQKLQLTLHYSGAVLSEAANGLLYVGEHGTWYPNIGFQMSNYNLEFHYPAGWTLLATGRRTNLQTVGGEQVSRWQSERPVPIAGFNLGRYSRTVTHAGKIEVETYATGTVERGFPQAADKDAPVPNFSPRRRANDLVISKQERPSPSQHSQEVGNAAAAALDFYQQRFGAYPYSSLELTQFPGTISQGWPGLIFLSSYAFLSAEEREQVQSDPKRQVLFGLIVPHETAHQWWGDSVIWSGYRDQWIMEALSNYSAVMLLESRNPAQAKELLQLYRDDLLTKSHDGVSLMDSGPVTLGLRLSSSKFPGAYEAISYGRGTWLFHMLRMMLRDSRRASPQHNDEEEPFVRALRKLRTQYEFKPVTTQEVISAFESELPPSLWYEGHKSLKWFYDSWVNGTAVPQFSVREVKFAGESGATHARGTIIQEHAPDSLVTSVPLYAAVGNRTVALGRVFAEGHETAFRIAVPPGTRKILVDPEQTILSRSK
jgi:Peptidase family M1 domain